MRKKTRSKVTIAVSTVCALCNKNAQSYTFDRRPWSGLPVDHVFVCKQCRESCEHFWKFDPDWKDRLDVGDFAQIWETCQRCGMKSKQLFQFVGRFDENDEEV